MATANEVGDWDDASYVILYIIQGRKILIDVHDGELYVRCINKTYVDAYNIEKFHNEGAFMDINN